MTSPSKISEHGCNEGPGGVPLSAHGFQAWLEDNAASLTSEADVRQAAQAAVNWAIQPMLQKGLTLNDAGDILTRRMAGGRWNGVYYPPSAVRSALSAIGWQPKKGRASGGDV